ncbi:MAG: hypothetical protein KGQ59_00295 [Bdellovibrionales bacterium]|nr:hypothetical protein [Bdellovibrionales bacterium]
MKNVWVFGIAVALFFSVGSSTARAAASCGGEWNGSAKSSKPKMVIAQTSQQGTQQSKSSKSAK